MITVSPEVMFFIDYLKIGACWGVLLMTMVTIGGSGHSFKIMLRGFLLNMILWPFMMTWSFFKIIFTVIDNAKKDDSRTGE